MYQLPREFGSFNGLAVFVHFSGLCAFGCSVAHLNQQFPCILTLHLHYKMRLNVNLHFVTLFTF